MQGQITGATPLSQLFIYMINCLQFWCQSRAVCCHAHLASSTASSQGSWVPITRTVLFCTPTCKWQVSSLHTHQDAGYSPLPARVTALHQASVCPPVQQPRPPVHCPPEPWSKIPPISHFLPKPAGRDPRTCLEGSPPSRQPLQIATTKYS